MKESAQKINSLIKESKEYQLYKNLKNKIDEDQHLKSLSDRMNSLKKVICKDRNDDLLKALQSDALLGTVPAVKNGAVALIEDGSVLSASCTPSALSIPATIDEYLEILGNAASNVK